MRALVLPFVLLVVACRSTAPGEGAQPVGLEFLLATESSVAGVPVEWASSLHFDDGSVAPVVVDVLSDTQTNLHSTWHELGKGTVLPEVAGTHLLTATATWEDRAWFGSAWLLVTPDEPAAVDLVLSGIETRELVSAVQRGDIARLTRVPGVGKKTSERIVLELKDRLAKLSMPAGAPAVEPAGGRLRDDLLSALQNLGYQRVAAEKAVDTVLAFVADATFEQALRGALRELMR